MRPALAILAMTLLSTSAVQAMPRKQMPLQYPTAPSDYTVDNYFGIKLADPYRPLENDTAAATLDWVRAENALTRQYLDEIPYREAIRKRLGELFDFRRSGTPFKGNDGLYYVYDNDGLQNQSVLYRMKRPGGKREVFLDPNKLSKDGTVALKELTQSPDGRYTAYCVSRNGSDWVEIYVMDTKSRKLLKDHIEWAKFTDAQWHGNDGFFYSAYDRPVAGKEFSNANEYHKVYYHKLGTPQSDDKIVYEDRKHPLHFHTAMVPEGDKDLLFVFESGEGLGNAIRMKRLDKADAAWVTVEPTQDIEHTIVDVVDGKIYIITTAGAPRGRLMIANVDNPSRENWKELVGEQNGVLKGARFAGDKLLLTYERDAADHVEIVGLDGKSLGELKLPGYGAVALSSGRRSGDELFYSFTSFTSPTTVYETNLATGKTKVLSQPQVKGVNFDDYVTEQVFYTSKDGTKVPMFLTYKKGIKRDGHNPVYLYGYGGFNVSLTPGYNPARMLWLENGGIYAQANLRGGSEYGDEWHIAGTKQQKMNVFNDFIAAAEWLCDNNYTTPDFLTIEGGSNGGLLVGATTNLRPDLFAVAIPRVGVMDMMRYHLFTIGWNWASDYGRSDDSPEMAKYLLGYSPLHNIRNDNTEYPAILVTTADHDDRVVPAHSFKYAATLQEAKTGDRPKLIRIDSNAGHGAGKPVAKTIDEWTDIYSFIFKNIGVKPYSVGIEEPKVPGPMK